MKAQLNKKINKLYNINLKSIDDENRTVTFVFSDDSIDRYGEKVDQKTWDVTHYKNNPVVLWATILLSRRTSSARPSTSSSTRAASLS
ncbi:hypothetical protein [Rathayibacter sp. VKM Ac-2759]|uniref:hypothetical protein n=1 Tax=Rathayibacter sp. VKM Ac-2759 TaxID=2609252 RepID=UPI001FCA43BC|nr:hypothetical protein [Rathayibacter sp. VKM Ac-2759]